MSGTGARFPAKYERALFALDWPFGTMWAAHNEPDGATFKSTKEEFIAGKPIPFKDVLIHRKDGAMYFTTGDRRSQGALYRVTYEGSESTAPAPAPAPAPTAEARVRHLLEADSPTPFPGMGEPIKPGPLPALRRAHGHRAPAASGLGGEGACEKNPQAAIEAAIALARMGKKRCNPASSTRLANSIFPSSPKNSISHTSEHGSRFSSAWASPARMFAKKSPHASILSFLIPMRW